jgi:hypothetical protein
MIDVLGKWLRRASKGPMELLEIRDAVISAAYAELNESDGSDAALDAYNKTKRMANAEYLRGISVINERY